MFQSQQRHLRRSSLKKTGWAHCYWSRVPDW